MLPPSITSYLSKEAAEALLKQADPESNARRREVLKTVGAGLAGTVVGLPLGYGAAHLYGQHFGKPGPEAAAMGALVTGLGSAALYNMYKKRESQEIQRVLENPRNTSKR